MIQDDDDDAVVEMPPFLGLKEKVGTSSKIIDVMPYEKIEESQSILSESQKDFLIWVKKDLRALETACVQLENRSEVIKDVRRVAFSLKAQSGTFGYLLASLVAKSLFDFCEKYYDSTNPSHIMVIRKHVETLETIFKQRIENMGGEAGEALTNALKKLVHKAIQQ